MSDIDLTRLARVDESRPSVPRPRKRWIWALVPAAIAMGFVLVVFQSARSLFESTITVSVVRPLPASDEEIVSGAIIVQAAGWVEPDPFPVKATALETGVVRKMLVQEADVVALGDPLAELVDEDARLDVAVAEAKLARARSDLDAARAERDNARAAFDAALEVTEAHDVARATLDARIQEHRARAAAKEEASAAVEVARLELETQRFLSDEGAVGPWQLELAEARLREARARIDERAAAEARAAAERVVAETGLRRAERDVELRLAETLRVETSVAKLAGAQAALDEASASLARARLRLERMIVRSPVNGVVLTRTAQPGSPVGPSVHVGGVCDLYDPRSLRVRVDVPQAQVARVSPGLPAEIRCEARADRPYAGRVLRIVETADIQKVTLEVQIRVEDPDEHLKPEMLCQVAIRANPGSPGDESGARSRAVRIPARCLVGSNAVWILDALTGRATLRRVKIGARAGDELTIQEGLSLSDKVIDRSAEPIEAGDRVTVESVSVETRP